ncbi:hypothetical protein HL653_11025 [Sphingomonas sp. AP4-R1]|nr:hypothetical protein [Sphingomonas sp. AP4-R1]QJU58250.1 hypothetical protein HL653_11025 [Sphingomonas sp. AP4-R1]
MIAMLAIGVIRLATDAFSRGDGQDSLALLLDEGFDALRKEFSASP